MQNPILKLAAASTILAIILLFQASHVLAAPGGLTFTVNNTADVIDINPGDQVCETGKGNGICTLRAAINEANANPGADVIQLGSATYKITTPAGDDTGTSGDLDITDDVVLQGKGTTKSIVDGNFKDRVFDLMPNSSVEFHDLAIAHGTVKEANGGGIRAQGLNVQLINVLFDTNNGQQGGGIYHAGANMYLESVAMRFNHATGNFGGAILNSGPMLMLNSTLYVNYAQSGAGLYNENSALVINSTFSGNRATSYGGGISNAPANLAFPPAASLDLSNVTITGNIADEDSGGYAGDGGGISNVSNQVVSLRNTIIAGNTLKPPQVPNWEPNDCLGKFVSSGYNLIGAGDECEGLVNNVNGDQVGTKKAPLDSKLMPLAKNGGWTMTHALDTGSPARDMGDPSGCKNPYNQPITTDQRDYLRPMDGGSGVVRCDIGAYEANSEPVNYCNDLPLKPVLSMPGNNSEINVTKPLLDWRDAKCAVQYKVLVRQDTKNGARVFENTTRASQIKLTKLAKGHSYFWSIKACNRFGCTTSETHRFAIKP